MYLRDMALLPLNAAFRQKTALETHAVKGVIKVRLDHNGCLGFDMRKLRAREP